MPVMLFRLTIHKVEIDSAIIVYLCPQGNEIFVFKMTVIGCLHAKDPGYNTRYCGFS